VVRFATAVEDDLLDMPLARAPAGHQLPQVNGSNSQQAPQLRGCARSLSRSRRHRGVILGLVVDEPGRKMWLFRANTASRGRAACALRWANAGER